MEEKFETLNKEVKNSKKKKRIIIISIAIILVILLILFFVLKKDDVFRSKSTLIVETPQKISLSQDDTVTLDVTITNLGEAKYPAFSSSISFDNSKLAFLGLKEGNVYVYNNATSGEDVKLPEFSCNVEQCNKSGLINIMYLDTTGGKNAFSKELLEDKDNVVYRMNFRIKGSARAGEVYNLIVEDAVFATSDEKESLAMIQETLKVKNGKIVVGE